MVKIIIDAMGGDHAPGEVVKGSVEALSRFEDIEITLVGQQEALEKALEGMSYPEGRLKTVFASQVIETGEVPVRAVRQKKDSSMVVGMRLLAGGEGDAFISAGSTGALLTAGILIVHTVPGVHRPALAPILPTARDPFMLIDCGANVDCKPVNLQQFAMMGSIYMQEVAGKENPRVGLINIGAEEEKGNELTRTVYQELQNMPINFIGNVEARDIPEGNADVLVCDAFVGNVVLKFMEGLASTMFTMLKKELMATKFSSILALGLKKRFASFKKSMDYTEYGGAPLLGLNKCVIKAHGSSNAKAFCSAIRQAREFSQNDLSGKVREGIARAGAAFTRDV